MQVFRLLGIELGSSMFDDPQIAAQRSLEQSVASQFTLHSYLQAAALIFAPLVARRR
jgi:hypothetical protein